MKARTKSIFAAAAVAAVLAGATAARHMRFSRECTAVCACAVRTNQPPRKEAGAYHDVGMTMRNRLAAYGERKFRDSVASAPCDCDASAFRSAVMGAEISVRSSDWREVEFDAIATSADRAAAIAAATAYASAMKDSFDSELAVRFDKAIAHLRAMRRHAEHRLAELKATSGGDTETTAADIAAAEMEVTRLIESEGDAAAEIEKCKDEFTVSPVVVHPPKWRLKWR